MAGIDDLLDGAGDQLGAKIGPLAVWQWAAAGAAGWAIVTYGRRALDRPAAPSAPPEESFTPALSFGGQGDYGQSFNGGLDTGQDTDPDDGNAAYDWAVKATELLRERGYDAGQVWGVLSRGIAGAALTAEEVPVWEAAIAAQGPPPPGTPAILVDVPPEPTADRSRRPVTGWGHAIGDSGRQYVVEWGTRRKYLVTPGLASTATTIFGPAISQQSQAPYQHRNEQRAAENAGVLPQTDGLNLNVRTLGWTEPGLWTIDRGTELV